MRALAGKAILRRLNALLAGVVLMGFTGRHLAAGDSLALLRTQVEPGGWLWSRRRFRWPPPRLSHRDTRQPKPAA